MDPLVSFVIPCYKLAHMLPDCVNSILKQDYENFEVLVMDNCSPDRTSEVAQSFNDPRVKHIRNETNIGHIRNFNKGIALARGEYVWMLCVDDMLRSPHVLGRYVDLMERNPGVGLVFCRAVDFQGGEEKGIAKWADHGYCRVRFLRTKGILPKTGPVSTRGAMGVRLVCHLHGCPAL